MRETSTRPWARSYDWAEVVLGVVAVLSPVWLTTDTAAMWTLIVLGALITIDGLGSLAAPDMVYGEGVQIVLGVLLFISPWVIGYSQMMGASWTSWIIGVLSVVAGAAALPMASQAHSRAAGQH